MNNKQKILQKTREIFSQQGYEGVSMRKLADELDIAQSLIYHHYKDKDTLLKEMYDVTRKEIGALRPAISAEKAFQENLADRVRFQLEHGEYVATILKYYFHNRAYFPKHERGFIPEQAYTHIEEVLAAGVQKGQINVKNIQADAQVITHAINGFVMEYFPAKLSETELEQLAHKITDFLIRGIFLKGGDEQ